MLRQPTALGRVTEFQLMRWIRLLVVEFPHKKFMFILSISLQTLEGSMVLCMMCVGMAVVTAVIRVWRLARDRAEAFQLVSLKRSLSMRKLKALVLRLLVRMGTPRYFHTYQAIIAVLTIGKKLLYLLPGSLSLDFRERSMPLKMTKRMLKNFVIRVCLDRTYFAEIEN